MTSGFIAGPTLPGPIQRATFLSGLRTLGDLPRKRAVTSHHGQRDAERRATEIAPGDVDMAAMLLDDVANDRQAEAGALAVELGRVERLEDFLAVTLGDAGAGVGDLDQDAGVAIR